MLSSCSVVCDQISLVRPPSTCLTCFSIFAVLRHILADSSKFLQCGNRMSLFVILSCRPLASTDKLPEQGRIYAVNNLANLCKNIIWIIVSLSGSNLNKMTSSTHSGVQISSSDGRAADMLSIAGFKSRSELKF